MINKQVRLSTLNRYELNRYLGYKNNTPDDIIRGIIDECEKKLFENVKPAYICRVFDIKEKFCDGEYSGIEFEGTDLLLEGNSIRNHLKDCSQAALISATLSGQADKLIRQAEIKDMAKALILDTLASVAIEQVCDMAEAHISELFKSKYMTYRFGVGYGDLPLYHEKMILDILDAGKNIGLCCNENNILIPRKSVVCIVGISDSPLPRGQKGCATCNMASTCNFRRQGISCGHS